MSTISARTIITASLLGACTTAPLPATSATADFLMWQMPTTAISYPIYVYSGDSQVGYLYSASQQAFVGSYDPSSTSGSYQLYYNDSSNWFGCTIALSGGGIDTTTTTCPGTVINPPVSGSNVYTVGPGATAWPAASAPSDPTRTDYGKRRITFINHTQYSSIQLGEHCTVSVNPDNPNCVNQSDRFRIAQGEKQVFVVDDASKEGSAFPAGLNSYSFTLTAYQDGKGKWVDTGGYGAGEQPYATKIELTSLPVNTVNGVQIPTGATNFDVSAVDGFNVSVKAYPASPTYCTYTVPPESSNILGAGHYGKEAPLAELLVMESICQESSQLPAGQTSGAWNLVKSNAAGEYEGCMSPCSYATQNYGESSNEANLYCCAGPYATAASCDQPPGQPGANNSSYVSNLAPPVSTHVYRFAYDDAIGDFACPAETDFIIEFVSLEPM